MKGTLIKSVDLKNSLRLKFYDISRKLAGDRWYIGVMAEIDIPLTDSLMTKQTLLPYSLEEIRNALGSTIRFKQTIERHFIDGQNKDALLKNLLDSFLKSSISYLSHPDFAVKYVIKEYKKYLEWLKWYKEDILEIVQ